MGYDPLVTHENIRYIVNEDTYFCETFLLVIKAFTDQNIFLGLVGSHGFIELGGQGLSQSLIASNAFVMAELK